MAKGFTLIELMVVITIVAIIFGYAIPTVRNAVQNDRMTTQANELIADLNLARSEAIKRSANVVVCRRDPTAATPTCSTAAPYPWEAGRIIYVDADADNAQDAAETILRVRDSIASEVLTVRGNDAETQSFVSYNQRGMTNLTAVASGATQHHFRICDNRGNNYSRGVMIDATGRTSVVRRPTIALSCP